eukprot:TRINITY_DN624_c0_g4_i2.p1 TRINITY_DN624_c0_g4~~TRINITY_DN624_c0_g4_i2.p1  ORF type:complete len:540 (+),score=179.06 TRINITY_DN624_c0_g4_i2:103-1620(+)
MEDRTTAERLLTTLATPPPGSSLFLESAETLYAGSLFLETKFFSGYKGYWIILKGNRLHCFKKQTDTKPKRIITICFAAKTPLTMVEKERMGRQFPDSDAVSHSRILIFSPEKPFSICATNDAELKNWEDKIIGELKANMSAEAFQEREEISKQLLPIVERAVAEEIKRAEEFLNELRAQGLASSPHKPLKQGHLKLLIETEENQRWKKYYFSLHRRTLAYQSEDKSKPKGTIALRTSTITPATWARNELHRSKSNQNSNTNQTPQQQDQTLIQLTTEESNNNNNTSPNSHHQHHHHHPGQSNLNQPLTLTTLTSNTINTTTGGEHTPPSSPPPSSDNMYYGFIIRAPFVTYKVRAKHQVAATQWIEALEISKRGDFSSKKHFNENLKRSTEGSLPEPPTQERPLPSYTKPYVEYILKGKPKQVKLKGSVLTIGRSSTNDVILDDKKISRQHAQIQFNSTYCNFIDLGSSHGSQLNGAAVTQAVLYPNDELIVGETKVIFRVGAK